MKTSKYYKQMSKKNNLGNFRWLIIFELYDDKKISKIMSSLYKYF